MELMLICESTGPGRYAHPCWFPWTWSTWPWDPLFRRASSAESDLYGLGWPIGAQRGTCDHASAHLEWPCSSFGYIRPALGHRAHNFAEDQLLHNNPYALRTVQISRTPPMCSYEVAQPRLWLLTLRRWWSMFSRELYPQLVNKDQESSDQKKDNRIYLLLVIIDLNTLPQMLYAILIFSALVYAWSIWIKYD